MNAHNDSVDEKPSMSAGNGKPPTVAGCVMGCGCFLILLLGFISFMIWISIPVPSPTFTLNDVKFYAFNFSTLNSHIQITISCHNDNIDFHFDQIDAYASYRNQQITLPTNIPPMYLHAPGLTVWSPYLNGTQVPVPPTLALSLAQDQAVGTMLINVHLRARLRSKYRSFKIRNRLKVNCPTHIMFGNNNHDKVVASAELKRPFGDEDCDVKVS